MVAKVIMVTKVTFELNFPGNLLLAALVRCQKKRYYLGIFPNMGGSSQIPKLL